MGKSSQNTEIFFVNSADQNRKETKKMQQIRRMQILPNSKKQQLHAPDGGVLFLPPPCVQPKDIDSKVWVYFFILKNALRAWGTLDKCQNALGRFFVREKNKSLQKEKKRNEKNKRIMNVKTFGKLKWNDNAFFFLQVLQQRRHDAVQPETDQLDQKMQGGKSTGGLPFPFGSTEDL